MKEINVYAKLNLWAVAPDSPHHSSHHNGDAVQLTPDQRKRARVGRAFMGAFESLACQDYFEYERDPRFMFEPAYQAIVMFHLPAKDTQGRDQRVAMHSAHRDRADGSVTVTQTLETIGRSPALNHPDDAEWSDNQERSVVGGAAALGRDGHFGQRMDDSFATSTARHVTGSFDGGVAWRLASRACEQSNLVSGQAPAQSEVSVTQNMLRAWSAPYACPGLIVSGPAKSTMGVNCLYGNGVRFWRCGVFPHTADLSTSPYPGSQETYDEGKRFVVPRTRPYQDMYCLLYTSPSPRD